MPRPHETGLDVLADPDELRLIRKLSAYPSVVQASAVALEPHRITFYLQELAALLHTFYYKHRIMPAVVEIDAEDERFVAAGDRETKKPRETVTPDLTAARLAIRNGLDFLVISAPDLM